MATEIGFGDVPGPHIDDDVVAGAGPDAKWHEPHVFRPTTSDQFHCSVCAGNEFASHHIEPTREQMQEALNLTPPAIDAASRTEPPHPFFSEGGSDWPCDICGVKVGDHDDVVQLKPVPDETSFSEVLDRAVNAGGGSVARAEAFANKLRSTVLSGYEIYPGDIGTEGPSSADVRTAERIENLRNWWGQTSYDDADMVAEKAVTYGSNSLMQLGRKMAQLAGRKVEDEEALELGCWTNMVQKVERWTDAVMRGERPKDDTLTDIVAYAMMVRRIRESGGWPDGQN